MTEPTAVHASMLIRREPASIFDAFVSPEALSQFWLESASAPLAPGAEVTWHFKVPGISDRVTVVAFDRPHKLAWRFSDGMVVEITCELQDEGTRVAVACMGFAEADLLKQATNAVEGFSIVLCDLKTLLETGRSAHLVRDKAVLITRQLAQGT